MTTPSGQVEVTGDLCGTLIDLIGKDATFKLVEAFGGRRLYVPKTPRENQIAWNVVGEKCAKIMSSKFGGDALAIPIARRWRIMVYRERGMTHQCIARLVGCHEGNVWKVLREMGLTSSTRQRHSTPLRVGESGASVATTNVPLAS
jgi:hypothetical protein